MKTFKKSFYFLFVFAALALTACGDDDSSDDGGDGGGGDEFFRATVDGNSFAADTDLATLIGGSLTTNAGITVMAAQGSTNNGDFINFTIINYNGEGVYRVGDALTNNNGITYGELNGGSVRAWISNGILSINGIDPGTITITSQDADGAEGTFSFTGYSADDMTTKQVMNGEFKIEFDN